jgi:hypothetical protein
MARGASTETRVWVWSIEHRQGVAHGVKMSRIVGLLWSRLSGGLSVKLQGFGVGMEVR